MPNALTPFHHILFLVVITTAIVSFSRPITAAEPPEYFRKLIEQGNVTIEFYQPGHGPKEHAALATFKFYVRHNCTFRINWTDRGRVRFVTIRPTLANIKYELTNKIYLPKRLDTDAKWEHWLLRHEFDHVAMTVDPRLRMLIESLYREIEQVNRRVAVGSVTKERWALGILDTQYAKRRDAVIRLLQANEDLLDDVTKHGAKPIPDREEFFRELFGRENLLRMEFPYVHEVADLLRSRAFREAELPYAMDD